MMNISKIWSIIRALFVVALISSTLLALVHHITKEPIQEAQNRLISEGIKEVIVTDFDNDPFAEKIVVRRGKEKYTLYRGEYYHGSKTVFQYRRRLQGAQRRA